MEIYTDMDGQIVLKKYSPMADVSEFAVEYAESIAQNTGMTIAITDRDCVIAAAGTQKKNVQGKHITKELNDIMDKRQSVVASASENDYVKAVTDYDCESEVISPIICAGGSFYSVRIEDDNEIYTTDELIKYNSDLDMAIIRINRKLNPLHIYDGKQKLVRGQKVVAIGSPLQAFFILDVGQGVFHGVDGFEIGEIQLRKVVGVGFFRMVENVFFLRRTVKDDVFLLGSQILERDICAHPHRSADIFHQRPHQRVPRSHSPFVNREVLVRDKRGFIHSSYCSGSVAFTARSLAVERQFLSRWSVEMLSARRADKLLSSRHQQRWLDIVTVRTSVTRQS